MSYVEFTYKGKRGSDQTEQWEVVGAAKHTPLGVIEWYSQLPFRSYVFKPVHPAILMDVTILKDIAEFIQEKNLERN